MFIFGKDHYIKLCITTFSWQKMAEGDVSKITLRIMIMSCVSAGLCLRFNVTFWGILVIRIFMRFFMRNL